MNTTKQSTRHVLAALAFAIATLAAVYMLTFVWLTAFVYHDNIRGYVPAGLTGLLVLGVAMLLLVAYLYVMGRKQGRKTAYFPVGCLGVLLGILLSSMYTGILMRIVGYTLKKDIAISLSGVILFMAIAIVAHRMCFNKKAANNALQSAFFGATKK
jgi:hypothetical protein